MSLYTIKMQVSLILLMRKSKIAKYTNTVVRSAHFCQKKAAHTKGVNSKCEYNSYTRKKLNNQSANRLFSFLYGESLLPSLGIQEIPANDIIRNRSLHCIIFQEFAGQEGNHKYSRSKYHSYHSNIENKGQQPSLQIFYELVTHYSISVDQFFFPNKDAEKNTQRRQLDTLLDGMSNDGLEIVTATAQKVVEVEKKHEAAAGRSLQICFIPDPASTSKRFSFEYHRNSSRQKSHQAL